MRRVVVESPLAASNGRSIEQNIQYAKLCGLDCIRRGDSPYISHLLMTQFLDDTIAEERKAGMEAGFVWAEAGQVVAVYTDFGTSKGMTMGIENAHRRGQTIEYRTLPPELRALADTGPETKTPGMK